MPSIDDQYSDFRQWLGARLRESTSQLTEAWLVELGRRLPASSPRRFPTELLFEQVTSLLERLFRALATGQDPTADHSFRADVSALALFRRAHGFEKDELVVELELLSQGVFDKACECTRGYPNRAEPQVVFDVAAELRNALSALSALTVSAFRDRDREERRAWATLSSSFTRSAVHELRNRLNAAMLRTELTLPHSRDARDSIDAALNLVSEAVEDLSRVVMAQGVQEPDHRTRPLENLIVRVVEDLRPVAGKARVRVEALQPLPTFHIDAGKAYLMLVNLVGCAINHARASRPPGAVELVAEALPALTAWRIDVAVRHPGKPPSLLESGPGRTAHDRPERKESPSLVAARQAAAQLGALFSVDSERRPDALLFSLTVPEPPSGICQVPPFEHGHSSIRSRTNGA